MKVYGPYKRKDGRSHVVILDGSKRRTQSYPRYLMEKHLGRELLPEETVDHIDENFENDSIDNLQLLSLSENVKKSSIPRQLYYFVCPVCKKEAVKFLNHVRGNHAKGRSGPYCGRRCAGVASHAVRSG